MKCHIFEFLGECLSRPSSRSRLLAEHIHATNATISEEDQALQASRNSVGSKPARPFKRMRMKGIIDQRARGTTETDRQQPRLLAS